MYTLKPLPSFTDWLNTHPDVVVRSIVIARIKRLELGLWGDVRSLGEGVSELRIHIGSGWRVYFTLRNKSVVVLLVGGCKKTQTRDIHRAKVLASLLD